jgi:GntR family transcriptional regulator
VEKRRGLGMFVKEGARRNLMKNERDQFLKAEWPQILQRIQRLGLDLMDLARDAEKGSKS